MKLKIDIEVTEELKGDVVWLFNALQALANNIEVLDFYEENEIVTGKENVTVSVGK